MGAESDWIFLRGLVRESAHWDDFPARFASAIPGARAHLVDLPGTGQHWRQASPTTVPDMLEVARRDALGLVAERPFYLLSISLGSMVALEWATRHTAELAGVVLINTSLRGLSPLHRRLSCASWPLLCRILAARDVARRERLILALTSALKDPGPGFIESRVAIHQRHPVRLGNVFRQLWAAARHRPALDKPAVPVLLLNSQGDRMVDPGCTQAIARRWGVRPETHPWAGHDLPLDDPGWVLAALAAWLGQSSPQWETCR